MFEKNRKKFYKYSWELFLKINSKNCICGKNIYFCKILENYFSENEIFENWSMAVGISLFLHQVEGSITRVCLAKMKHLKPLNVNSHQDHD